jgi:hypothetical protein
MTVDGANDYDKLQELVDASLRFTNVLKKKGVSQATLTVRARVALQHPDAHELDKYRASPLWMSLDVSAPGRRISRLVGAVIAWNMFPILVM